jgi:hypothetical protein
VLFGLVRTLMKHVQLMLQHWASSRRIAQEADEQESNCNHPAIMF